MRAVRVALVALVLLALPPPAHASFPGANGKLLLQVRDPSTLKYDIWSMNPDGSGSVNITNTPSIDEMAGDWSPDGTKIAFIGEGDTVWSMNADGSARTDITPDVSGPPFYNATMQPTDLAWSPDGDRIAVSNRDLCGANHGPGQVILIDPDGSDPTRVVCGWPYIPVGHAKGAAAAGVSWSPSGEKLALNGPFTPVYSICADDVWVVNRDGTGMTGITQGNPGPETGPNWSPNGARLAFADISQGDCDLAPPNIWTMNPDGSSPSQVSTAPSAPPREPGPLWSPDGARLAHGRGDGDVWLMDADGSDAVNLTNTAGIFEAATSWLAIPQNAYPRPKGATPFYGSLATAYKPCTAPDRTHGPPLGYPSCSSLQMTSDYLTVGTGDSNQRPARNEGHLRLGVVPGIPSTTADEADVALEFFSDDVFTKALADYTGELRAKVLLQITDKNNTPSPGGPGAATTTAIPLELTVGCTPVADPQEGSSCTASTSADALAPGTVKEGRRAIWALGRVEVYDGGADGDAQTPAGDTLFATQGVFVP